MKKWIALIGVASLAACQQAEAPAEEEAVTEQAAPTVANGSPTGAYESTREDGSVVTTQINDDGTYSDTAADGTVLAEGTWAVVDGKTCFTPTGEDAVCYTESAPAEDGSFTVTPDGGEPFTVRPAASGATD